MKIQTLKNRYKNENEKTREYMCNLIDSLVDEFGAVNDSWVINLDLVSTWVTILFNAQEKMLNAKDGIEESRYFRIINSASNQIIALSKLLATNPATRTRLNTVENKNNKPLDAESLISALIEE